MTSQTGCVVVAKVYKGNQCTINGP